MSLFKGKELLLAQKQLQECEKNAQAQSATLDAIKSSVAFIAFSPDGIIESANDLLLELFGYQREQLLGQHHRVLCEKNYTRSEEYRRFWQDLATGSLKKGRFPRIDSNGNKLWLEGNYFPVKNAQGRVERSS